MPPSSNSKYTRTFGQASRRSGATRYQRQQGNSGGRNTNRNSNELTEEQEKAQRHLEYKLKRKKEDEAFDVKNGFRRFHSGSLDVSSPAGSADKQSMNSSSSQNENKGLMARKDVTAGTNSTVKRGWVFNILPTVSRCSYSS